MEHTKTSNKQRFGLIGKWAVRDFEILKIARKFNLDILIGDLNPCVAHGKSLIQNIIISSI